MKITFVMCLGLALSLISCKPEKTAETPATPEPEPSPTHPWDLEPSDSALVAGKQVYLAECSGCHNEGEEGAPALTKSKEWAKRSKKGLPKLYQRAINGFIGMDGEMPARGGTPTLTDEEVQNSVRFMVEASK